MRVVLQRVKKASVTISEKKVAQINQGLLLLLGIEAQDTQEDIDWLVTKICNMRIFQDQAGAMNLSVQEVGGDVLVVSQFTLHASTKKGNRPSFIKAARPEVAIPLYTLFIQTITTFLGTDVQTGNFGAMMDVSLVNDGPVTIVMDSKNRE